MLILNNVVMYNIVDYKIMFLITLLKLHRLSFLIGLKINEITHSILTYNIDTKIAINAVFSQKVTVTLALLKLNESDSVIRLNFIEKIFEYLLFKSLNSFLTTA